MRTLAILVLGGMIAGAGTTLAAEDHNSTRSNEGLAVETPADNNTIRSKKWTTQDVDGGDSDIDNLSPAATPRDAASGLPTGKRQHQP